MFEIEEIKSNSAKIKVVGVGGAGGNAVNNMISANLKGIEFIAINTDSQILNASLAPTTIQIGQNVTRGLGAGSDPEKGRESALEDRDTISEHISGADMVFITAGMGGGTGTGAAPVIADIAKEHGALTVAVVTKPFFYEGKRRSINAEQGLIELKEKVDSFIVIPNDRIRMVVDKGTPLLKSFAVANDILRQAVQGISDLILTPGLINLDFADVDAIMNSSNRAVMGVGVGSGENGTAEAAKKAISNPLLEDSSIDGAKGILINITGGLNLSLVSIEEATGLIYDSAHEDANIIFGAVIDPDLDDEVRVTVIATGFDHKDTVVKEKPQQIKKWEPRTIIPPKPVDRMPVKASTRVLSKSLVDEIEHEAIVSEVLNFDDVLDTPTFLRNMNDSRT
ncbi:MAG: cell division protein FtsZ [Nitrospirota bacterium]|nr:MAG: cell division protein FtsZ [Nitrospirota bacterium]